jgi:hypothetical protein
MLFRVIGWTAVKPRIHLACIPATTSIFEVPAAVVKQKKKVKMRVDCLQAINTVFQL